MYIYQIHQILSPIVITAVYDKQASMATLDTMQGVPEVHAMYTTCKRMRANVGTTASLKVGCLYKDIVKCQKGKRSTHWMSVGSPRNKSGSEKQMHGWNNSALPSYPSPLYITVYHEKYWWLLKQFFMIFLHMTSW